MGAEFFFPRGAEYWTPAAPRLARMARGRGGGPIEPFFNGLNVFYGLGRLAPNSTISSAGAETTVFLKGQVAKELQVVLPATGGLVLTPILDHVFGRARPALLALMGAVVVVLLVACVNVAGLLFAQGASRVREIGGWRCARGRSPRPYSPTHDRERVGGARRGHRRRRHCGARSRHSRRAKPRRHSSSGCDRAKWPRACIRHRDRRRRRRLSSDSLRQPISVDRLSQTSSREVCDRSGP